MTRTRMPGALAPDDARETRPDPYLGEAREDGDDERLPPGYGIAFSLVVSAALWAAIAAFAFSGAPSVDTGDAAATSSH